MTENQFVNLRSFILMYNLPCVSSSVSDEGGDRSYTNSTRFGYLEVLLMIGGPFTENQNEKGINQIIELQENE